MATFRKDPSRCQRSKTQTLWVYMYFDPKGSLLHMGPLWDFDIGFGNINYNDNDKTEGFWIKNSKWLERMFLDPVFVDKLQSRWVETKTELDAIAHTYIPLRATEVSNDMVANFNLWPILGVHVWPNADGYENRTTYQLEVDYLTEWLTNRISWLNAEIKSLD